ncbi:MAG: DNA polymerase III subunit delta [Thermodesulfobacteriota bacterium]
MSRRDLSPSDVAGALKRGKPASLYLFHGPNEFMMERSLLQAREALIPESARAFNLEIFYAGESDPADILARARSVPFLAERRLIIVRGTEHFREEQLEPFLAYLEKPVETTCMILVCLKADFKRRFYKALRSAGLAVGFEDLKEDRIPAWIRRTAEEMGFKLPFQACVYLQQVAGDNLRDIYGELEKLRIRYGNAEVGVQEIRELAVHSRSFTIFELMNRISTRNCADSLAALGRFLEEEDRKSGPLQVIGMLNRQMRLLWATRETLDKGGKRNDVAEKLGSAGHWAEEFMSSARHWSVKELERVLGLLYQADGLLKTGSPAKLVLENLVFNLCARRELR